MLLVTAGYTIVRFNFPNDQAKRLKHLLYKPISMTVLPTSFKITGHSLGRKLAVFNSPLCSMACDERTPTE